MKSNIASVLLNQLLSRLSGVGKQLCMPSKRAEAAGLLFKTYMIHTFQKTNVIPSEIQIGLFQ